jgi:hypothetical protein
MRAVDAGDLAEELSRVFVNHHEVVFTSDAKSLVGRIWDDVIPAAVAAENVDSGDVTGRGCGGSRESGERQKE